MDTDYVSILKEFCEDGARYTQVNYGNPKHFQVEDGKRSHFIYEVRYNGKLYTGLPGDTKKVAKQHVARIIYESFNDKKDPSVNVNMSIGNLEGVNDLPQRPSEDKFHTSDDRKSVGSNIEVDNNSIWSQIYDRGDKTIPFLCEARSMDEIWETFMSMFGISARQCTDGTLRFQTLVFIDVENLADVWKDIILFTFRCRQYGKNNVPLTFIVYGGPSTTMSSLYKTVNSVRKLVKNNESIHKVELTIFVRLTRSVHKDSVGHMISFDMGQLASLSRREKCFFTAAIAMSKNYGVNNSTDHYTTFMKAHASSTDATFSVGRARAIPNMLSVAISDKVNLEKVISSIMGVPFSLSTNPCF